MRTLRDPQRKPFGNHRFKAVTVAATRTLLTMPIWTNNVISYLELPWPSGYELQLSLREVAGSNPGKGHWWMTGRASGPKMLTAPAKSQLIIGHRPSPLKTGSV